MEVTLDGEFPSKIVQTNKWGVKEAILRTAMDKSGVKTVPLLNGRPVWDLDLWHSFCWLPFANNPEWGFWCEANLRSIFLSENGSELKGNVYGHVFCMNRHATDEDRPVDLPHTATQSKIPPLGVWCRGRPWNGSATFPRWEEDFHLSLKNKDDPAAAAVPVAEAPLGGNAAAADAEPVGCAKRRE